MKPRLITLGLAMVLLVGSLRGAVPAPSTIDREKLRAVVAAYLINFAVHVRWPAGAMEPGSPLTITILGRDPFGAVLDQTIAGRAVAGHPLRVVRADSADAAIGSQIVFIDQPTPAIARTVVDRFAGRPVLVVAFEASGDSSPAAIDLVVMPDGTVRYKLALEALRGAGLTPSPGLLQHSLRSAESPGASAFAPVPR